MNTSERYVSSDTTEFLLLMVAKLISAIDRKNRNKGSTQALTEFEQEITDMTDAIFKHPTVMKHQIYNLQA